MRVSTARRQRLFSEATPLPDLRRSESLPKFSFTHGDIEMSQQMSRKGIVQSLLLAGAVSLAVAAPAFAGECPAGKAGANPLPGAATAPVGVVEMELSSIDLGKEAVNLPQRRL